MRAPITLNGDAPPPFECHQLAHPDRTLLVRLGLYWQYQIVLCAKPRPGEESWRGHGPIIRQCCTYQVDVALEIVACLVAAPEPDQLLEELARPWNCEGPGGRIRLDNRALVPPHAPTPRRERRGGPGKTSGLGTPASWPAAAACR